MTKTVLYLFSILTFIACEKATEDSSKLKSSLSFNNGYSHQPPYVTALDEITGNERELEFTITDSLLASTADWNFYDSKHSDTLSAPLQQYIGWIVLQKKDLINLAHDNPTNITYQEVLKKHINSLVDSDYKGYCLLYHALKEINDPQYQTEQAAKIIDYAKNDSFLEDVEADGSADLIAVVRENYSYLDNLEVLANQLN